MQGAQLNLGVCPPMRHAQGRASIWWVPDIKRRQDEIARQNLVYVIEACSRRLGKSRGGVVYLARLIGTQDTYLSQLANHYKGRNIGRELKDKIESKFGLDPDWMDHEHDEGVVAWLVSRVPSLPHSQNKGIPGGRSAFVELQRKLDEALNRISELESRSGSAKSSRSKT